MQRMRLASRLWLAILPIALAALLAGAFVTWTFLQEATSHEQAADAARVAESTVDALRGVWVEAEAVDATTWGVDVDTAAARDIADAALAALERRANQLAGGATGDGAVVAASIVDAVDQAQAALVAVRSRPATETDPDRYGPVTELILSIVPKTSFFIDDRAQAREIAAAANLAEAARVTFGEEQLAAARPVLNFVTEVESSGDGELTDASVARLTAAEAEFADWLARAAAVSPTAAADVEGIASAPMLDGFVDPDRIPVDRFEQVLAIAERLSISVAQASTVDAGDARQQAFILIVITGTILLIAGWAAFATSRTVVRRVRTVTEAAKQIANVDLPNLVDALRNPQQQFDAPTVMVPLEASQPDEVGELARSFGALHTTLIEVAGQQMEILRKGVSEIFVTLARRNQALVDRQLALIDQLESSEEDPEILGGYYKLDHLATRMRRNAESLLVLAGTESPRVWAKPLAMGDVVRAALGEVDDYQRIDVLALEPARVSGSVVTDLAHLISELLDNAAQFSPPTERVRVTGLFERAGYLLTISDGGIGMSDGRMAELNRMLEAPPVLGLALEPTLGMYVVARLAARHGVKVELVSGVPGTTARITIPRSLLEATDSRPAPARDEQPAKEALPHTLRAPAGVDEPVPAMAGGAPYSFRSANEPAMAGADNGHAEKVSETLLAKAAALTDANRRAPAPDESEPIETNEDRPSLPTRRRPAAQSPAVAQAQPAAPAAQPSPPVADPATDPTPIRQPAAESMVEAAPTAEPDTPDSGTAPPSPTVEAGAEPSSEPRPVERRGPGPSLTPPDGRRRAGVHRAAARSDRAPWDRSGDDEPGPATLGARVDAAPQPSADTEDWWGPKRRPASDESPSVDASPTEPAVVKAAHEAHDGQDDDAIEALPLRSPGMTFKEASNSGDSSSPSRFGASGIRAALTAYRTGRDSADEGGEEDGGES